MQRHTPFFSVLLCFVRIEGEQEIGVAAVIGRHVAVPFIQEFQFDDAVGQRLVLDPHSFRLTLGFDNSLFRLGFDPVQVVFRFQGVLFRDLFFLDRLVEGGAEGQVSDVQTCLLYTSRCV